MCRVFPQYYILEKYVNYAYTSIDWTYDSFQCGTMNFALNDRLLYLYLKMLLSRFSFKELYLVWKMIMLPVI